MGVITLHEVELDYEWESTFLRVTLRKGESVMRRCCEIDISVVRVLAEKVGRRIRR